MSVMREDMNRAITRIIVLTALLWPGPAYGDFPDSLDLGDLKPGQKVTITFKVTVKNDVQAGIETVANQGTVSGSNFTSVDTDDPDLPGTSDPTETPLDNADSDGDLLSDLLEDQICTSPVDADTDDDGIPDGVEDANHNGTFDSGETNPCDADTDDDLIQDGTEMGVRLSKIGPDTDTGIFQEDLDPTTTTDPLNPDTDGDRMDDGQEDRNLNGAVDDQETDPNVFDLMAMPWLLLLLGSDSETTSGNIAVPWLLLLLGSDIP
jgi:hypothetical protein